MIGSLDHVLANAPAEDDVNAVDIWDINGYESVYYEYARFNTNVTNLYAPNPFRSSDHSPEIMGINTVKAPLADSAVAASVSPGTVRVWGRRATVKVKVTRAAPGSPTGTVEAVLGGIVVATGTLVAGKVNLSLPPFESVGRKSIQVRYLGDSTTKPSTSTVSIKVIKAEPRLKVRAPDEAVKGEHVPIRISVSASGFTPTGTVVVTVGGRRASASLVDGSVTIWVRMEKPGSTKVEVSYGGDSVTEHAKEQIRIKVRNH